MDLLVDYGIRGVSKDRAALLNIVSDAFGGKINTNIALLL